MPITVVGGGPVGTLLALRLAQRAAPVRVLERRADPRQVSAERGRSINLALAARGLTALDAAGLTARLMPELVPMRGRLLHDERGQCSFLPYGSRPSEVIWSISRERLNQLLLEAAGEDPRIELVFDARCLDVDPQGRILRWQSARSGEHEEPFELLLGADGAGSAVRGALVRRGLSHASESALTHDYKELSITAAAASGWPREALHIWPRGGFMLIALPNADGSFTATLFLARNGAPSFERLGDTLAVRAFFAEHFPDVAAALPDLEAQFLAHPQGRLATLHCDRWQALGCVGLLGDAAHAIVPFHGQGLNAGFEDCVLLDRLLACAAPAEALLQFEQQRRPDAEAIATMALENYEEMRQGVRDPLFAARAALAARLEQQFPARFIPRYAMVMFHPEIPYREARARGARQSALLDELMQRAGEATPDELRELAARLLDEHGL
ncbi:MAG TPA: NAD(P)/FAD-dependent oxidoreductase [Steroidobacteraceae bacterium]|nr:NAD(P)/FAD-dependent oxidoreductase [Steroidobacteraceae bacterium]